MNGLLERESQNRSGVTGRINRPPRILCADDEPSICLCVVQVLSRAGYIVVVVSDGQKAWETLERGDFDLLLTDHNMPGLTGCELVARARQHGMKLPVIVMSAQPQSLLTPATESLQIATFLQKPFSVGELTDAVKGALHLPR